MKGWLTNLRFYILSFSIILSLVLAGTSYLLYSETSFTIKLQEFYALTAVTYLYFTLLAGPLCYTFRFLPLRGKYLYARRALGVSAFYFGLIHTLLTFFGQLGGFSGLGYLSGKYLIAISLSFTALVILTLLTVTAFDSMVERLTYPRWKLLHRFVYLAAIFITIHALMLGTHFSDLSGVIPQIFFVLGSFLLFLEGLRIDAFIKKRFSINPQFGIVTSLIIGGIVTALVLSLFQSNTSFPLSIHAEHIRIAKEAQKATTSTPSISSAVGDRTKRYSVSFNHPDTVVSNVDTPLTFQVFDASNGNLVSLFQKVYDKYLHLIIVNDSLTYFSHIHPEINNSSFGISTQFPSDGMYHLYLDFQPFGAIEQQFAFTLPVGQGTSKTPSFKNDTILSKQYGQYEVTLQKPDHLSAIEMAIGNQTLTFTIKEGSTHKVVTTLKPYLGAYGHLVMINTKTYDYIHVHPSLLISPKPNENGGPTVSFIPLGLYGPIRPGQYRVFAQFNPNNELFVADYTVQVE